MTIYSKWTDTYDENGGGPAAGGGTVGWAATVIHHLGHFDSSLINYLNTAFLSLSWASHTPQYKSKHCLSLFWASPTPQYKPKYTLYSMMVRKRLIATSKMLLGRFLVPKRFLYMQILWKYPHIILIVYGDALGFLDLYLLGSSFCNVHGAKSSCWLVARDRVPVSIDPEGPMKHASLANMDMAWSWLLLGTDFLLSETKSRYSSSKD